MAKFTIPRLVGKTNKAGLTTWYWQPSATLRKKGWAPRRLGAGGSIDDAPADVADAARRLNEEVDGARALPAAQLRRIQQPLSFGDGIRRFRDANYPSVRQPGFTLDPATAKQYEKKLKVLEAWGGDVALTSITDERIAKLRDGLMKPAAAGRYAGQVRHHHAHETLRVGRALWTWFEQQRLVPRGNNPFTDFGLATPAPRQQIWWPAAREAALAAAVAAGDASMELAIDLAFSIGQREADLLRLQLGQYVEIPAYKMDPEVHAQLVEPDLSGRPCVMGIRLRQKKGKTWIEVPVVGATRRRIEAQIAEAKRLGLTTLLFDRARGLPWTMPTLDTGQRRFIGRFGELRDTAIASARVREDLELAAELEDLQFRDLRRTAVVYLGELGIPDHLIAAITGHSLDETKKILETYLPLTTGMAARAIALSHARGGEARTQEQAL